jgi:hypothetical protein
MIESAVTPTPGAGINKWVLALSSHASTTMYNCPSHSSNQFTLLIRVLQAKSCAPTFVASTVHCRQSWPLSIFLASVAPGLFRQSWPLSPILATPVYSFYGLSPQLLFQYQLQISSCPLSPVMASVADLGLFRQSCLLSTTSAVVSNLGLYRLCVLGRRCIVRMISGSHVPCFNPSALYTRIVVDTTC